MAIKLSPNFTLSRIDSTLGTNLSLPMSIQQLTLTGNLYHIGEQTFSGGTEAAVELGDVTTARYVLIFNQSSTDVLTLGKTISATYYPIFDVAPRFPFFGLWNSGTLQAKVVSGTITVSKFILEA